jgi:sulfur-oxidizing protein SoxZ
MADIQTKIRTKIQDGVTDVMVLVTHPMETGQRTDPKTKEKIPPYFIQKMIFFLNDKEVVTADLGTAVAQNPLIVIKLKSAKPGDKLKVTWSDNKGGSGGEESVVS